jgi:hypothetical protein
MTPHTTLMHSQTDPSPRQDNDAGHGQGSPGRSKQASPQGKLLAAQEIITLRHDVRPELAIHDPGCRASS